MLHHMNKDKNHSHEASSLRLHAEELLKQKKKKKAEQVGTSAEEQRLIHELNVHQIELEITNEELRRANLEIEESLRRYADLYDFAPVAYFTWDKNSTIISVNLTGSTLLRLERRLLLGTPFHDFIIPACRPTFSQFMRTIFRESKEATCEVELQKEGNQNVSVRIEGKISDSQQGQKCCIAVIMDISDRRAMEKALMECDTGYRLVIDAANEFIYELDLINHKATWNESYATQLGRPPEASAIGQWWIERIHPEDRDNVLASYHESINSDSDYWKKEYRFRRPDGTYASVFDRARIVRNGAGKATKIYGAMMDMTALRQCEEELMERARQLEQTNKEIESQAGIVRETNTALKVLLKRTEEDKVGLEQQFLTNIKKFVFPHLEDLKRLIANDDLVIHVTAIEKHLHEIGSPMLTKLSSPYLNLTPREIQIAYLIKEGKNSKQIMDVLNLSKSSVDFHRRNIRAKLDIKNKVKNLRTSLLDFTS